MPNQTPYLWDYDLSASDFQAILSGELTIGRLGQDWAALRLLEYAPYLEIIRLLGYPPPDRGLAALAGAGAQREPKTRFRFSGCLTAGTPSGIPGQISGKNP
jgi:hypothetical protein